MRYSLEKICKRMDAQAEINAVHCGTLSWAKIQHLVRGNRGSIWHHARPEWSLIHFINDLATWGAIDMVLEHHRWWNLEWHFCRSWACHTACCRREIYSWCQPSHVCMSIVYKGLGCREAKCQTLHAEEDQYLCDRHEEVDAWNSPLQNPPWPQKRST